MLITSACKSKIKYIVSGLAFSSLMCITQNSTAKNEHAAIFFNLLTGKKDTTKLPDTLPKKNFLNDTLQKNFLRDTSGNGVDSIKIITIDTLEFSKDSLDAEVNYEAEDSGVLIIDTKKFMLYGKAKTAYTDVDLDANTIIYDQATQMIKAFGGTDTSLGALNKPKLTQGDMETISDTIVFNTKTKRGLTKNTFYKQDEIFFNAQRFKMVTADVGYAYKSIFTTCNLDTPHFGFKTEKLKIVNNKIAVSGPTHPVFEGVPVPIYIPFGIFPLNRGRHSGLLPPQFATNQDFGLGLENFGYYKVLGEYWDVTLRGNLYSYGGWTLNITPEYFKRYRYRGNFNLALQKTKILNSAAGAKEEFTESQSFMINWSHSTDQRARPGTSFSASVRAGSTKFNRYIPNSPIQNFNNQLNSSISWSKIWDQGKYSLNVSANHDQNNNLGLINLRIPTVTFSATTIYPFQKKERIGESKWYEKLGISYNGTILSQISFYDSAFNVRKLLDTAQWGAEHRIPVTLALPPLGPLIVAPSVSYGERWFGQRIVKEWNDKTNKVDTTISRGFYAAREINLGLSLNTRIFGTVNFPKSNGIKAIRHEIKPFVSLNYKPDLVQKYYRKIQTDSAATRYVNVSDLDGGVLSSYPTGKFGGMSFGIDNLFEMKVKDKKDTAASATKKVRLIDGLSINGGYNFLADTMQWSQISISFRSTLFEKVNITGSTYIDPYDVNEFGDPVNELLWKKGKIGRITNGSLAISTSLSSKKKDERKDEDRMPQDETLTPDEQMRQLEYIRQNPSDFVDFNIPWNVQLSLSLSFSRRLSPTLQNYITQTTTNLSVNGDFSLTPKWKAGGSTYYDFKTSSIQSLTMFITREMHCWQMSINVTPIGYYPSFSITINPKSGILRDLKINRSRYFSNQ